MAQAIPLRGERILRMRSATTQSEKVRNMHLVSIGVGACVGSAAPDVLTGTLLGVATVKSIEYAAQQLALFGIALWVNK